YCSFWNYHTTQWFEPYLDLLENQSPSCLINNWDRFKQQFFTLFGDPNEDNGKASTYIAQFRTLQSRVDWNDAAFAFSKRASELHHRSVGSDGFGPAGKPTQLHQPQRMKMLQKTSPPRIFLQNLQPLSPCLRHHNQRDPPKLP
ncbi:uncharacterized protein VP01_3904g1, partial [Puccinia sorghi]